jgi:hypothetical protein
MRDFTSIVQAAIIDGEQPSMVGMPAGHLGRALSRASDATGFA